MNKRASDMQRMMRELKESNKRMMKIMSKHFAQLAMSNREIGTFPNQSEVNLKAGSSSFDPNHLKKVNTMISL